jgi:cytochrome c2
MNCNVQGLTRGLRKITLGVASVAAAFLIPILMTAGQVTVMPGSVIQGERLLDEKGCLRCHAVNGRGGKRAPDFIRASSEARTPALFASVLWNHSPKMWEEFEAQGQQIPPLDSSEVADLFAYFYSTLYFSPPGSSARGRNVFEEKNCVSCHSEVLDARSKRSIDDWRDIKNPIAWAEQMWNHASAMDSATTNRGIRWPKLSDQDVVDLLMFLSNLPEAQTEMASFNVGEPRLGRIVFERSCDTCHTFSDNDKSKVNLLTRSRPLSVTGYIAAMWNHAPDMRRHGGSTPRLNAGDMPDLIAFLFAQRYFLDRGDVSKGRRVFEEKGCAKCHTLHRKETGAPDLSQTAETFSPITLTSAVWRHGPSMLEKMKEQNIPWPRFTGSQMADLITYLNSQLVIRIANDPAGAVNLGWQYDVSRDGRFLVNTILDDAAATPITLLQNWQTPAK